MKGDAVNRRSMKGGRDSERDSSIKVGFHKEGVPLRGCHEGWVL